MAKAKEVPNTMGVDQYGTHYDNLGQFPRKALLERMGCSFAEKMYNDLIDGGTRHTGYVISGCWITLYSIKPWKA
jgi:hypothetical protein